MSSSAPVHPTGRRTRMTLRVAFVIANAGASRCLRPAVLVVLLLPQRLSSGAGRGSRIRPGRRDGLRRHSRRDQARTRFARCRAQGRDRCGRRGDRVLRQQRLAFPGVPGATPQGCGRAVRLGEGGRPLGGHSRHLSARERATRSTSDAPTPPPGCPGTAPSTGCARSTTTNPGTTNCARAQPSTAVRSGTPTRRTTRGRRLPESKL